MSQININVDNVAGMMPTVSNMMKQIRSISNQLESHMAGINSSIKSQDNINFRMSRIYYELNEAYNKLDSLYGIMRYATNGYSDAENKVNNWARNLKDIYGRTSASDNWFTNLYQFVSSEEDKFLKFVERGAFSEVKSVYDLFKDPKKVTVVSILGICCGPIGAVLGQAAVNSGGTWFNSDSNKDESGKKKTGENGSLYDLSTKDKSANLNVLGYSTSAGLNTAWDPNKRNIGITANAGAEGHLVEGSVKGSIGYLSGSAKVDVGAVSAKGKVSATLFKKGRLYPNLEAKAEASASVAKGEVEGKFGSEDFNAHSEASGSVLTAEAHAGVEAGKITHTVNGKEKIEYGVGAEAGAGAYLAKGEAKGGVTILGIKFDVGVEGDAGGASAKLGGKVAENDASVNANLGLGVGLGVKVDIDWSNFSLLKGIKFF